MPLRLARSLYRLWFPVYAQAHKPTSVTHALTGNFTSPTDRNLIVAKCTRIEIFLLTPAGLQASTRRTTHGALCCHKLRAPRLIPLPRCIPQLKLEVPIYGRISALELFRPQVRL